MGRALPVLLVVAVAFASVALGQGPEAIDERSTTCWDCHVAWPTPLKTFYNLAPPTEVEAAPGDVFDYTLQIENPWLHDITFVEPSLDLSNAPSLKFYDGRQPVQVQTEGEIVVDPTQAQEPQTGFVVVEVPTGATDLTIELSELDSLLDPDLQLWLYPGVTEPNGTPVLVVNNAGAGAAETFVAGADGQPSLAELGTGNWTVQAVAYLAQTPDQPNLFLRDIPFRVKADIAFNANDETTQYLSQVVTIGPAQRFLVTWQLEALALPGPGETAAVRFDATVHWAHLPSSAADDFANVTKSIDLTVFERAGKLVISSGDAQTDTGGVAVVTVSLASISESVGYASAFLLVASVWTGGIFGRASRRQLNAVFGTAKRRVAFHNFLSYGLTAAAAVHTYLFIIETKYHWTLGLIWGGLSIAAMLGLGLTGAFQVPMIRRWNYALWRWSHFALAIASLVFTVVHLLLDGAHFGDVQQWLGWRDPLDNRGLFNETA